eukprot:3715346-Prymnesium_polylepis.1
MSQCGQPCPPALSLTARSALRKLTSLFLSSTRWQHVLHSRFTFDTADVQGATVRCIRGDSAASLKQLEDNAYDLMYIDGDHSYKGACADIEAARSKLKIGGLLALNDYYTFEYNFIPKKGVAMVYGVIHATHEFLARYYGDWEVVYFALPADIGLRRIR